MYRNGKGRSKARGRDIDSGTGRSKARSTGRRIGRITDRGRGRGMHRDRGSGEAEAWVRQSQGRGRARGKARRKKGQGKGQRQGLIHVFCKNFTTLGHYLKKTLPFFIIHEVAIPSSYQ